MFKKKQAQIQESIEGVAPDWKPGLIDVSFGVDVVIIFPNFWRKLPGITCLSKTWVLPISSMFSLWSHGQSLTLVQSQMLKC